MARLPPYIPRNIALCSNCAFAVFWPFWMQTPSQPPNGTELYPADSPSNFIT